MSVGLLQARLIPEVYKKFINELRLNNGKEIIPLYKFKNDKIYIPYFYAQLLFYDSDINFEDGFSIGLENGKDNVLKREVLNISQIHKTIEFNLRMQLRQKQELPLKEAMHYLQTTGTVYLNACTAFGKSNAMLYLCKQLSKLTVVMATYKQFISQLHTTFVQDSDVVVWIADSKKRMPPNVQIILSTPGKWKYVPQEIIPQIGVLMLDEAPLLCTSSRLAILMTLQPEYIIACSATPKRKDGMHLILDMMVGPSKVIKGLDIPIRIVKWYTGIRVPYFKGTQGADWVKHLEYICENEERNNLIIEFQRKLIAMKTEDGKSGNPVADLFSTITERRNHKICTITDRVEQHVEKLVELVKTDYLTSDYLSGTKTKYKDSDILYGTYGKVGIGFDQAKACLDYDGNPFNIVHQITSANDTSKIMQELGRAARGDMAIMILMIDNNRISINHSNVAIQAFEELDDVKFYNLYDI